MHMGYLDGYNMYCPWHLAQFDIRTGQSTAGPGIQSLNSFPVEVVNGVVKVSIRADQMNSVTACVEAPNMTSPDGEDTRNFVIVGGGAAGHYCAETLRREGFAGKITILSKDS